MAIITRTSILQQAQDIAGLQAGVDVMPKVLNNSIAPTLDLNPRFTNNIKFSSTSATGTVTLLVTPKLNDLFITYAILSFVKDATSNMVSVSLNAVINGATIRILTKELLTATAENDTIVCTFAYPLKIDRNSSITLAGSFGLGTATKSTSIGYFVLE